MTARITGSLTAAPGGWSDCLSMFDAGWRWHWADLAGLQVVDSLPAQPPITTMMWGWTGAGSWARLRLDRPPRIAAPQIFGAIFTPGAGTTTADTWTVASFVSQSARGLGVAPLRASPSMMEVNS